MSSSRSAYISIQELNETKKPGKLKARVSRLWEVLNPKDKDQLLCVDMVLIDEQGDYVHASIWSNCADAFRSKLKEGDIYIISNFSIESNKPNYKVVSHSEILIRFTYNTHIKAIEGEECIIPKHKFDFTPYGNLEQRRMKPIVLSDVYGVLKNEIFESNATTIELEDKSKNTIRVKLWGQFSTDYKQKKAELDDTSNLFIVVVTSTLVKGFTAANIRLDTSSSSQIYINLDIPEVNEFRGLLSGCNEEIIVGTSTIERDGELSISKKEITEILDHCKSPYEKVSYYHVEAKVNEVMSDLPWFYYFCPDCNKMLKPGLKTFKCDPKNCNKIIDNPYAGYRLELMVTDSSGSSTILTLFNDVAKKLINHEATTLRGIQVAQAESSEEHDRVPEIIRNELEGKTFTFKLKVDAFNHSSKGRQTFAVMKVVHTETFEVDEQKSRALGKRPLEVISLDEDETCSSNSSKQLKLTDSP